MVVSAAQPDPFIDFWNLKFPEPANPMGGQTPQFSPPIDSIFCDPEMARNFLCGNPRLCCHAPNPLPD